MLRFNSLTNVGIVSDSSSLSISNVTISGGMPIASATIPVGSRACVVCIRPNYTKWNGPGQIYIKTPTISNLYRSFFIGVNSNQPTTSPLYQIPITNQDVGGFVDVQYSNGLAALDASQVVNDEVTFQFFSESIPDNFNNGEIVTWHNYSTISTPAAATWVQLDTQIYPYFTYMRLSNTGSTSTTLFLADASSGDNYMSVYLGPGLSAINNRPVLNRTTTLWLYSSVSEPILVDIGLGAAGAT